jgi:hypothetical protein
MEVECGMREWLEGLAGSLRGKLPWIMDVTLFDWAFCVGLYLSGGFAECMYRVGLSASGTDVLKTEWVATYGDCGVSVGGSWGNLEGK